MQPNVFPSQSLHIAGEAVNWVQIFLPQILPGCLSISALQEYGLAFKTKNERLRQQIQRLDRRRFLRLGWCRGVQANIPGQWRPAAGPVSSPPSSHHLLICQIVSLSTPSSPQQFFCTLVILHLPNLRIPHVQYSSQEQFAKPKSRNQSTKSVTNNNISAITSHATAIVMTIFSDICETRHTLLILEQGYKT